MPESDKRWDPTESFFDPLAATIAWTPLSPGRTSSFRTHEAVAVGSNALELRATREAKLFGWSLIVGSLFDIVFVTVMGHSTGHWGYAIPFYIAGALFSFVGLAILESLPKVRFDRRAKRIARSAVKLLESTPALDLDQSEVHAVQVVPSQDDEGFRAYEINLILKDSSRVALVSHTREEALMSDARAVAAFLDVPLWIHDPV